MPGIFGRVDEELDAEIAPALNAMAARMRHHSSYKEELYLDSDAAVGLGALRLEFQPSKLQSVCSHHADLAAVVDGEIYDAAEQRLALQAAGHAVRSDNLAELLIAGYEAKQEAFFPGLHGKFAAAIWDRRLRRLVLVNDRFGMRPLYYAHLRGRLLFASEIKALLADPEMSSKVNLRGVAQFFTFGQLLAEDTMLEGVRLLPAAGYLIYDLREDRVSLERYWRLSAEPLRGDAGRETQLLDGVDHAFGEAVRRCTAGVSNLGLSLSGGLDSRTILGAIDDGLPLTTVSVGMAGSADHRCAAAMSQLTNRVHQQCLLGTGFLERFEEHLRHMVRLTDGHYLSQCIVMPTLPLYRDLGIQVLLRGHAGELMHMRKAYNFSMDAEAMSLRDETGLRAWLYRRLQAYLLDGTDGRLFAAGLREDIEGLARDSLHSCLAESAGMQPAVHRIWLLFLTQRLRRETAMSLVKFGSLVETRVPYLDNELIDALFAMPPELKIGETVQAHILRLRRPSLLKVLNVNTGARMNAGRLGRFVGKVRHKVLAKLGVRGYQPYERLGLWLRRELRPLVQKLLLADECLQRGVFEPETVRKVVEDHFQGKNHTFLLLAMMTFEMGQKELASVQDRSAGFATTAASHI